MPRQRRGIRGDVGIAPYVPSTESVCVSHRADRVVRPYNRLPYLRLILALSFRASDRCHLAYLSAPPPAAKGRYLPLPLCGKGAI